MQMGVSGVICAIQAGSCAAMASISAKLAASSEIASSFAVALCIFVQNFSGISFNLENELTVILRLAGVAGIFMFNALMWVLFTKSMHLCSSTLEATAFNTSSNFFFTAVVGKLLFGEHLGWLWCVGSALMVIGLAILHTGSNIDDDKSDKIEDEKSQSDAGDVAHQDRADKKRTIKKER